MAADPAPCASSRNSLYLDSWIGDRSKTGKSVLFVPTLSGVEGLDDAEGPPDGRAGGPSGGREEVKCSGGEEGGLDPAEIKPGGPPGRERTALGGFWRPYLPASRRLGAFQLSLANSRRLSFYAGSAMTSGSITSTCVIAVA
jgi:hypothetical protein